MVRTKSKTKKVERESIRKLVELLIKERKLEDKIDMLLDEIEDENLKKEKDVQNIVLHGLLKNIILSIAKRRYPGADIEVIYDSEEDDFIIIRKFKVVEDGNVRNKENEMSLTEAKRFLKEMGREEEVEVGDEIEDIITLDELGRREASQALELLVRKISEIEEKYSYGKLIKNKGKLISGKIKKIEFSRKQGGRIVYVDLLGGTTGVLLPQDQLPNDQRLPVGTEIKAIVKDVRKVRDGQFMRPEVLLSRTTDDFIIELFKKQVREIEDGIIRIKSIAREPGVRTKIAVWSPDPTVDAVGTCVGLKGAKIKPILQELGNSERIDVIGWSDDIKKLVADVMSPAQIKFVRVDKQQGIVTIVVPDEFLSVCIGRKGINIKLTSKLIGMRVDVYGENEVKERSKELLELGISDKIAEIMWIWGVRTIEDVVNFGLEKLKNIPGILESDARKIYEKANEIKRMKASEYGGRMEGETERDKVERIEIRKDEEKVEEIRKDEEKVEEIRKDEERID